MKTKTKTKTKMKTKTTIELTTAELILALEQGTLVGSKIKSADWQYGTNVWYQSGAAQYEKVCTGVVLEVEA